MIRAVRLPTGVRRLRAADVDRLGRRLNVAAGAEPRESAPRSIEELAAVQGVEPVASVQELALPHLWSSDEELDEFVAVVYAERERDR